MGEDDGLPFRGATRRSALLSGMLAGALAIGQEPRAGRALPRHGSGRVSKSERRATKARRKQGARARRK